MSRSFRPALIALASLLVAACGVTGVTGAPATTRPPVTATAPSGQPSPAAVSCAGEDLLWDLLPPPAQAYALAWLSSEQPERLARLREGMTANGSYSDPETPDVVAGLPAIAQRIGAFQASHDGHFLRVRAWQPTDDHHDYVRVRWILCRADDGSIVLEGEDILVVDESGLIRQATRFVDS